MIPATCFKNRNVALFGLGVSGLPAARSLIAGGCALVAWDDNPKSCDVAAQAGIHVADLKSEDWTQIDALILAPGVPLTHPEPHWTVKLAKKFDVPIIGDVEIFERERAARAPKSRLVAVTGTNGKSTTTALIAHTLEALGESVGLGGNIGRAVLELEDVHDDAVYVIEYSSYQIDLTPGLKPDAGLLLNLSPDHLDRHGTMAHYAEVKARLVMAAAQNGVAIIGVDDQYCIDIAKEIESTGNTIVRISVEHPVSDGVYARDGILYECHDGIESKVGDLFGADALRGDHNAQNAAAAYATARHFGYEPKAILHALKSFPGLAHRMEPLGKVGSVQFVNDSKGTNADATAHALQSFDNIFWIAGGRAKSGGIEPLSPFFGRIRHAFLIGEAAEIFAKTLSGKVSFTISGDLVSAVRDASRAAQEFSRASQGAPSVVLLSPAAASFDQYRSFEVRGDAFRNAVKEVVEQR